MGILDDAIREHLELRRRNGAGDDEVQQLERSLLGDAPEAEAQETPAEPASEPVEPDPEPAAAAPEPAATEPEPAAAEPEPEPAFELAPVEQPTRQFTAAEVEAAEHPPVAGDDAPAEHDELEETPDFLQETPEHDRLWFEQKPPKDFDF